MATRSAAERTADRAFFTGLARAFGGAVLFALPLLMTMEMWWLGFYLSRLHLMLFMVLMIPLLVALDYYSGFEETRSWREDWMDGMIAGSGRAVIAWAYSSQTCSSFTIS